MDNIEQEKALQLEAFKEKIKRLQTKLEGEDQTIQGIPVESLRSPDMEAWEESRNILKTMNEILQEQDFSLLHKKIRDLLKEIGNFILKKRDTNDFFQGWINNRIAIPKTNCEFILTEKTREDADIENIRREIDAELQKFEE